MLAKYHDKPAEVQVGMAKKFMLRWSFYTDALIRDLTLRGAKSFGSFHLIRHLYGEYMLHLLVARMAKLLGQPMISLYGGSFGGGAEPACEPQHWAAGADFADLTAAGVGSARPLNAHAYVLDGGKYGAVHAMDQVSEQTFRPHPPHSLYR